MFFLMLAEGVGAHTTLPIQSDMKQLLSLVQKINGFLYYLIQLGAKDGWKAYRRSVSEPAGTYAVQMKHLRAPFYLRSGTSDRGVFEQVFLHKDYELSQDLNPAVIVDCGANIGLASVFFANRYPKAKIIAVEPEKNNVDMARRNLQPYPNVSIEAKGVWNKDCHLEVVAGPDGQPWSFMVRPVAQERPDTIPAISIQGIIDKYNLSRIDILKIDIECSESELFAENVGLWIGKIGTIVIELHDWMKPLTSKTFLQTMARYDFAVTQKGENIIARQIFDRQVS